MTAPVLAQARAAPKAAASATGHGSLLQRQCACGGTPGPSGECEACRKKRQRTLQRSASGGSPLNSVPPIVHDVLRSPGQPLDLATRAFMEPRFGHDFSQVRVHTDARAAESAQAVQANAYTVGRNVVFGTGRYAPQTREGQRLLAHELVHVAQQGLAQAAATIEIDNSHEQETEKASAIILAGDSRIVINRINHPQLAREAKDYAQVKKEILEELNRKMPVAIFGLLKSLDQHTQLQLRADSDIRQAIGKLPPETQKLILKHLAEPRRDLTDNENKFVDPIEARRVQMSAVAAGKLVELLQDIITGDPKLLRSNDQPAQSKGSKARQPAGAAAKPAAATDEKERVRQAVRRHLKLGYLFQWNRSRYDWLNDPKAAQALKVIQTATDMILKQGSLTLPRKVRTETEPGSWAEKPLGENIILFDPTFFDHTEWETKLCWTFVVMHEYMHFAGAYHGEKDIATKEMWPDYTPNFALADADQLTKLVFDLALGSPFEVNCHIKGN